MAKSKGQWLLDIQNQRIELQEKAAQDFLRQLEIAQKKTFAKIQRILRQLEQGKGNIENSANNLRMAYNSYSIINEALREEGFDDAVNKYVAKMDKLKPLLDKEAKILDVPIDLEDTKTLVKVLKDENFRQFNLVSNRISERLKQTLVESVFTQQNFAVAVNGFRKLLNNEVPTLRGYAYTYANSALQDFDRQLSTAVYSKAGIERWVYVGSLVKDSRRFCVDRVWKEFTSKQIERWNDLSWQGKNPNSSVWVSLGGYNCQHRLLPASPGVDEMNEELRKQEVEFYKEQNK